jgi:hypothetical protein
MMSGLGSACLFGKPSLFGDAALIASRALAMRLR